MKLLRRGITLGMVTVLCIALSLTITLPLPPTQLLAEAPQAALTESNTYQLNLCLIYGADSPTPTPTCTPTIDPSSAFEQRVIELVNQERTLKRIAPLQKSQALMDAAREHSEDMARNDFFSHIGSDGSDPGERISRTGYEWSICAENVAAGYPSPADVVEGWMESADHRANILNPDLCEIGVGYAYNADATYGHYWAQDMAAR